MSNRKIIPVDGERLGRPGASLKARFVMTAVFFAPVLGVVKYDSSMTTAAFAISVRNAALLGYVYEPALDVAALGM